MGKRPIIWAALGIPLLVAAGFTAWLVLLPASAARTTALSLRPREMQALVEALKPPKRSRPLVAVIGINDATETTDYLMTAGILRRSDVADVLMVATRKGNVRLYPALEVRPDATIAEFDARNPEGADYVIVPAMSRDDDPQVMAWLKNQSRKGAVIVAVCAGAKVVSAAGLLDGRRATTHWYYLRELLGRNPSIIYVPNSRMVIDRSVATTTGITASMPMMLTMIEAIAGRAKAEAVAHDLGVRSWDARHDSAAFRLTRPFATAALANRLLFWRHERLAVELRPGIDEVSLAQTADAWSRTYRSTVVSWTRSGQPATGRYGIRLIPDERPVDLAGEQKISIPAERQPALALDRTLSAIGSRYGDATASIVAMQLEYPVPSSRNANR